QELPEGFVVQTQLGYLSDRNYLEQYFKTEFDTGENQDTFVYVKQQQNNWAWTAEADARLLDWFNQTIWLPRGDAWLIGQDVFRALPYTGPASAGYARLMTSTDPEQRVSATDQPTNTVRLDWIQEIAYPFEAGPFKIVPYGLLDTAFYSRTLSPVNQD